MRSRKRARTQAPHMSLAAARPGEPPRCAVCGGREYEHTPVLWPQLIEEWGLSPEEARYIDVQQGTRCLSCGCNARSIALARALLVIFSGAETLKQFVEGGVPRALRILEINQAGDLSPYLRTAAGHRLIEHPEFDMMDLHLPSGSFDVVIHSDTLEHVRDPLQALRECRRVLKPDGALVFSAPVVIRRLTRNRAGMAPSYHGSPGTNSEALRVHTEFGADVWVFVMEAGFARCEMLSFIFPSGLALIAR